MIVQRAGPPVDSHDEGILPYWRYSCVLDYHDGRPDTPAGVLDLGPDAAAGCPRYEASAANEVETQDAEARDKSFFFPKTHDGSCPRGRVNGALKGSAASTPPPVTVSTSHLCRLARARRSFALSVEDGWPSALDAWRIDPASSVTCVSRSNTISSKGPKRIR